MTIGKHIQRLAVASILLFTSCANNATHGHLKDDAAAAEIKIGSSSKDDVLRVLGSPSSESTFGPATWCYISSVKRTRSLFAPEVVDQHVTEISFDAGGTVNAMKQYGLTDGKNIEIASRTTPSEGQTLGFFEQMLSNLGRFNKEKDASSGVTNTHGTSPPIGGLPPVYR